MTKTMNETTLSYGFNDVLPLDGLSQLINILETNIDTIDDKKKITENISYNGKSYFIEITGIMYPIGYEGTIRINCSDQRCLTIKRKMHMEKKSFYSDYETTHNFECTFAENQSVLYSNRIDIKSPFYGDSNISDRIFDFVYFDCRIDGLYATVSRDYNVYYNVSESILETHLLDNRFRNTEFHFDGDILTVVCNKHDVCNKHEYEISLSKKKILSVDKKAECSPYSEYEDLFQFLLGLKNEIEAKKNAINCNTDWTLERTIEYLLDDVNEMLKKYEETMQWRKDREHELESLYKNSEDLFQLIEIIQNYKEKLTSRKISEFIFSNDELNMMINLISPIITEMRTEKENETLDQLIDGLSDKQIKRLKLQLQNPK